MPLELLNEMDYKKFRPSNFGVKKCNIRASVLTAHRQVNLI